MLPNKLHFYLFIFITNSIYSQNFNTSYGEGALNNSVGSYNTAVGYNTMGTNNSANSNTAIGYFSLWLNTEGRHNTAVGSSTLKSNTTGEENTAVGHFALLQNTTGMNNVALGSNTLSSNLGGWANTAVGKNALSQNVSGKFNTATGISAMVNNQTGLHNSAFGGASLYSNSTGSNNTAVGNSALNKINGDGNTAVGYSALSALESGTNNTAVGFASGISGDNPINRTVIGSSAVANFDNSVVLGNGAVTDIYMASDSGAKIHAKDANFSGILEASFLKGNGYMLTNLPVSYNQNGTGQQTFSSEASGQFATALGTSTIAASFGTVAIGTYNTGNFETSEFSLSNPAFVIGNGGWTGDEQLNRSDAFTVLFDGTTTIAGDLNINSDARLKANIISLGATLSKLLQIDAKTYVMKKDDSKKLKIGVLAQEIETVFPELVTESNNIKSVNYQGLVPVLINAIKEQNQTIETQQDAIESLEQRLQKLEAILLAKPN